VDNELKTRLQDAATAADKMWQREMSKAIRDGVTEIERLHQLIYEQGQRSATVSQALLTTLPYLRRIEQPSEEMFAAMTQDETPLVCRRKLDKSAYEVVRMNNPDWKEAITDDQTVLFEGSYEDAHAYYHRAAFTWRYSEMLHIAATQPIKEQPA
jgi:hypothetical protein